MNPLYLLSCRWALFLLFVSSLSACQRAGFYFQPSASAPYRAIIAAQKADEISISMSRTAVVEIARAPTRPRRAHQPRLLGRAARVNRPRVRTPALYYAAKALPTATSFLRQQLAPPPIEPVRYRSHVIALLLGILSITYIPLSLYNFYLGYYSRGALAIALLLIGTALLLAGWPGFLFGGSLTAVNYLGLVMLAGYTFWQLSDVIRIITGSLKPKNGTYGKRKWEDD